MAARKSKGAHGLRIDLMNIEWHIEAAFDALAGAKRRAAELGATDQLAIAVKALRSIANYTGADRRSKGLAEGALRRMQVKA